MANQKQNRRRFLQTTGAVTAAIATPYIFSTRSIADDQKADSANDRPTLGCIGTGSRWGAVGPSAMEYANCVAVCDVDANHAAHASNVVQKHKKQNGTAPDVYEDYRKVLDRKDIDIVTIVTTDHWHSKIAIEAMQAGKDVYCEKPLTLTIEEGKQISKVQKETGRVFQVARNNDRKWASDSCRPSRWCVPVASVMCRKLRATSGRAHQRCDPGGRRAFGTELGEVARASSVG